jgi:hypothetical protein
VITPNRLPFLGHSRGLIEIVSISWKQFILEENISQDFILQVIMRDKENFQNL